MTMPAVRSDGALGSLSRQPSRRSRADAIVARRVQLRRMWSARKSRRSLYRAQARIRFGGGMWLLKICGVLLVAGIAVSRVTPAQRAVPPAASPTARAVDAAKAFLATLDERQRTKVVLPLNAYTRTVWTNLP